MSLDASEVFVGGSGHIYVATFGATIPSGLATPGTAFTDLGYTTEDGVTFNTARETEKLGAWQSNDPLRILQTARTLGINFVLRQFTMENLIVALGGGTATPGTAVGVYEFAGPEDVSIVSVVVDALDGDDTVRFVYPRMQIEGDMEMQIVRTNAINVPVSLTNLASTDSAEIRSDAASWLSA